jgi:hypothetical protein
MLDLRTIEYVPDVRILVFSFQTIHCFSVLPDYVSRCIRGAHYVGMLDALQSAVAKILV